MTECRYLAALVKEMSAQRCCTSVWSLVRKKTNKYLVGIKSLIRDGKLAALRCTEAPSGAFAWRLPPCVCWHFVRGRNIFAKRRLAECPRRVTGDGCKKCLSVKGSRAILDRGSPVKLRNIAKVLCFEVR